MKNLLIKNATNSILLAETDSSLIRAELERLLSDRRFSGARQMSAFLRYIVSETLDGNGNRIKAYTVGVDALGKADDFDAQSDPSVRVLALRLRKSLEAAYANEPECHARIVMNVGSYVPKFYKPSNYVTETDEQQRMVPNGATRVEAPDAPCSSELSASSAGNSSSQTIESNAGNRRLSDASDASESRRESQFVNESRGHQVNMNSPQLRVVRMTSSPASETLPAHDKWVLAAVVSLVAVAWQVSINTIDVLPW